MSLEYDCPCKQYHKKSDYEFYLKNGGSKNNAKEAANGLAIEVTSNYSGDHIGVNT